MSTDTAISDLKSSVRLLGKLLGDVIAQAHGRHVFETVEEIRTLAKQSRKESPEKRDQLNSLLHGLSEDKLFLVARAFNQFLNLANIAEQLYDNLNASYSGGEDFGSLDLQFDQFRKKGASQQDIVDALQSLKMDLVLTAHPTEVTRRTIIEKQNKIFYCLETLATRKLSDEAIAQIHEELMQLIAQWWHTDEIRTAKPTPVDEAVWGFAVIENSLWQAVPQYYRQITKTVKNKFGVQLPLEFNPVQFTSWMGGDRDGNPNVTSHVTEEVIRLARWKAADLFLKDVHELMSELSMNEASSELKALVGDTREPYRAVLKDLRTLLVNTLSHFDDLLKAREPANEPIIECSEQLWQPLMTCYRSLQECGMGMIADGQLLNALRRVQCFGAYLLRLDIRQESGRHEKVFSELTVHLGLGDYAEWNEEKRQQFLIQELASKRPLFPPVPIGDNAMNWQPSADVAEVLATFRMLAQQPRDALGVYIISMARAPSDVLAVQLLFKESQCEYLPIAPLFETLDDLNNAPDIMTRLLSIPEYRNSINNKQMIMIGYSDSAKDAGVMAAAWAQYRAQENLLQVCEKAGVHATLFHGRGGTTGRGGAPAHAALLSQPPGSLVNGLRVTEQGEMIRFKLGLPQKAVTTLNLYTSAILQSNLMPPPAPKTEWRDVVSELAEISAAAYRELVFNNKDFLPYFRSATPINELGKLPLGSRPAKRKADGGIESLRAIPWSFAWSQNRLMLPAWYGAGAAIEKLTENHRRDILDDMCQQWPFFSTRISMLEMVYAKSDAELTTYYEKYLVDKKLVPFGEALRERLQKDIETVLSIANDESLLQDLPWLKYSLGLRNTYIDPLNLLQVELLSRERENSTPTVERALMVTIAGVAAGLRNTG